MEAHEDNTVSIYFLVYWIMILANKSQFDEKSADVESFLQQLSIPDFWAETEIENDGKISLVSGLFGGHNFVGSVLSWNWAIVAKSSFNWGCRTIANLTQGKG